MHAQAQPYLISPRRPGGSGGPTWTDELRLILSMHELSLSMPEPMLSLSMLILTSFPEAVLDVSVRTHRQTDILKFQHVDFVRFGLILI